MKAIIVKRYNGWELSEDKDGPLVRLEDVREVVDTHDRLTRQNKALVEALNETPMLMRPANTAWETQYQDWVDSVHAVLAQIEKENA